MFVTGRTWHISQISDKAFMCMTTNPRSVRNPGTEIEWPIVWLLSGFHRKHIFVPQKILESKHINNDAIRLTRRVEWTWTLRKDSPCLPSIHIKAHEIASCFKFDPSSC